MVIGDVVEQLGGCNTLPTDLLLASSTFVTTPDLPTTGSLLPHVVESDNLVVWNSLDMLGDIAPFRSIFSHALFEQFELLRSKVRLLEILVFVELLQLGKSGISIEAFGI
jgi:hypothetical protein